MSKVSVDDAARNLKALLEQVARGEEVILLEDDKPVARLVLPLPKEEWLDNTKDFRDSLDVSGEPLSATVLEARFEEHF